MKVADGRWRTAQIFGRKELPTTVVIFFGGSEYEGLDGGCKMDPLTGHIFDADGRMIEARPPQGNFGSVFRISILSFRRIFVDSFPSYSTKHC